MAYVYDDGEKWEKTGYSTGYGWSYSPGYGYGTARAVDARKALQPLLDHIRAYDALRQQLETEGGGICDVTRVTELLAQPITLKGNYRDCTVTLTDQAGLRTALYDVGRNDLHIDVRQLSTGMPVYYLCRIRRDYWSEYSLIVEDLYQSAGYPMVDERFVRLMDYGHETYYPRLSQFRDSVKASCEGSRPACLAGGRISASGGINPPQTPPKCSGTSLLRSASYGGQDGTAAPPPPAKPIAGPHATSDEQIDDLLYDAGRHVFQAAWHEDQRPGVLTAAHFGLPHFRQAIELLYLCLSGELCELRNATNKRLRAFFEDTYPQPVIHAFLGLLGGLDGAAINELPRKALKLYARLSAAFSRFLSVEVVWGHHRTTMPLYKLVFGNFSRLAVVAGGLKEDPHIQTAAQRLEQESEAIMGEIVE